VDIHHQHTMPARQGCSELHRDRRLAHPSLLVRERNDLQIRHQHRLSCVFEMGIDTSKRLSRTLGKKDLRISGAVRQTKGVKVDVNNLDGKTMTWHSATQPVGSALRI